MHAISADGITSKSVAKEFAEHAESEHDHMLMAAERIDQLGGVPDLDPKGLASRAATEYGNGGDLVQMIKDDLVAERLVIEHYQRSEARREGKDGVSACRSRWSTYHYKKKK